MLKEKRKKNSVILIFKSSQIFSLYKNKNKNFSFLKIKIISIKNKGKKDCCFKFCANQLYRRDYKRKNK